MEPKLRTAPRGPWMTLAGLGVVFAASFTLVAQAPTPQSQAPAPAGQGAAPQAPDAPAGRGGGRGGGGRSAGSDLTSDFSPRPAVQPRTPADEQKATVPPAAQDHSDKRNWL